MVRPPAPRAEVCVSLRGTGRWLLAFERSASEPAFAVLLSAERERSALYERRTVLD
jgi:hypothetical protein